MTKLCESAIEQFEQLGDQYVYERSSVLLKECKTMDEKERNDEL
jgi:hypothetical protein